MSLPWNAPKAYQPSGDELSPAEVARLEAETALLKKLAEEKQADIDRKTEEAKSAGLRAIRDEMEVERTRLYLDSQLISTDREKRREQRELAEEGMLGRYDFTKPIHGEVRGFFGSMPSSVDPFMQKIERYAERNPGEPIEVIFSSPGGEVYAGYRFYSFLRELSARGHEIVTGARGMTASMAGILLQAGDHRWMSAEGTLLIHQVSGHTGGSAYEIEDQLKEMKKMNNKVIDIFLSRSDMPRAEFKKKWKRKDWRLTADEAYEAGFIDEVR